MSTVRTRIRSGAYHDSIVLMALQRSLQDLPDIVDAGAVMGTETNLGILRERDLLPEDVNPAEVAPEDLLIAVRAETEEAAENALEQVDEILARRRGGGDADYRPKSLETAVKSLPNAGWVLVSVPGRHAAQVAEQALDLDRHVFLYSDNVPMDDEVRLKEQAAEKGLLVLGPDCGTTLVGGFGLGFANRVPRGPVGIVAASGTGLQAVAAGLDARGVGVSHALGTGGRDLSRDVAGRTALQALDLLGRDERTEVVVLISKPPDPEVASRLLAAARAMSKPTVVCFLGYPPPARRLGRLAFASDLDDAAHLAAQIAQERPTSTSSPEPLNGFLRGLFSGGTLAAEALRALAPFLSPLASNLAAPGVEMLDDPLKSRGHTVLDLGDDALTVGRLHPMMHPDLLIQRLQREAADPDVSVILLDVVLGDGAHGDPAGELAPALDEIRTGRVEESPLEVVAVMVGTGEDPQDRSAQIEALRAAGVHVTSTVPQAVSQVLDRLSPSFPFEGTPVPLAALVPRGAISVGVETFADSLRAQGAQVVSVDWKPPAAGNARLAGILSKIKSKA